MDMKEREAIALFRYGIIAQVCNGHITEQIKYFRQMARREHDVPIWGKRFYKPETFKQWLKQYRRYGIEGLRPKCRTDKGQSRKIDEHLAQCIKEILEAYPFISASGLYRTLVAEGQIQMGDINENTIRKFVRDNQLRNKNPPVPRKKFEKEHVNQLWLADCMHGPYLKLQDLPKKHKVFLIAAIDDHSRMIVARGWFLYENSLSLEIMIKHGILQFGKPDNLYCDNGAIFSTSHLQLACARLGIALIHSKPYDSPSRGKIERFFRTVRSKFMATLPITEINSLEQLNQLFEDWLQKEYHKFRHEGIQTTPMERYFDDIKKTTIKRVTEEELDLAFYVTIQRTVKNDSTISVKNVSYQCPHRFIGRKIEIRYPADKPHLLTIYQEDKPVVQLKPVDLVQNANVPAWQIRFSKEQENSGD
jgi:transposase InsO family protein